MSDLIHGVLNEETWADFIKRLRHDCVGEGVREHATADALFVVEAKRIITGIDTDYTDQICVLCEDSIWYSPEEYWDDLDDEQQAELDAQCDEDVAFLDLSERDQWDILRDLDDHTVTGWDSRWEYINAHFTKAAAERFIERKKHDYREGMRVFVESQYYAWEFNAIKEGILNGTITYTPKAA